MPATPESIPRPTLAPAQDPAAWREWFLRHSVAGTLHLTPDIERLLPALAAAGAIGQERLVPAALGILAQREEFAAAWRAGRMRDARLLNAMAESGALSAAFAPELFRFLAANALIFDAGLEFALTAARRSLLFDITRSEAAGTDGAKLDLLCALAQQCLLNDHAYWEDADETVWVELLAESLAAVCAEGEAPRPDLVALYAAYRDLFALGLPEAVTDRLKRTAAVEPLIVRAVDEPREERRIAAALDTVTPIRDEISVRVRAQYEENPYPRWRIAPRLPPRPCEERLRGYPGVDLAAFGPAPCPRILVAGCGTGATIIGSAGAYTAEITAVDLSRASLAYAKRQTDLLGLPVTYLHGDILELPALGRQFDIIECTGVLHHMRDPEAGARALWQCLRPGGLLRVALYTRGGREAMAPARDFIARGGYAPTAEGIRRFRRDAQAEAEGANPRLRGVTLPMDFYSLSMCRDLVFHVQERGYTVAEIEALAKRLGGRITTLFLDRPFALPVAGAAEKNLPRLAAMERAGEMVGHLHVFLMQKPADAPARPS